MPLDYIHNLLNNLWEKIVHMPCLYKKKLYFQSYDIDSHQHVPNLN
jgi:hypothetical protein